MLDVVEELRDLYVVMALVPGRPLGALVSGPSDLARTVACGRQLAEVLGRFHRSGIVYRDLNPLNVLMDGDGVIRLVDFELACGIGDRDAAAGTPGYASPQQLAGEPGSVADDVYGLGALLHFLATGADPGDARRRPPPEVGPVIDRCLNPDPAKRYPTMDELQEELVSMTNA